MTLISGIHKERPEDDPDIQISRYPGPWMERRFLVPMRTAKSCATCKTIINGTLLFYSAN